MEEEGLSRYLRTVRERLWMVIAILVVTTGAATLYVATADRVYEAQADLLVTPVPTDAEFLTTLGLPSRSADPSREVQTVAQLVTTTEVGQRASNPLRGVPEAEDDVDSLLRHVSAEPIAESNLVAITADAGDPEDAAQIANAFVTAMVAERTERLIERIDATLAQLEARPGAVDFSEQIAQLRTLRAQERDPTLQVATAAQPPTSPSAPRPRLTIAGALVAGLILGVGAAFTLQALDPRLRREEQLRRLFRLPILARIPKERSGLRGRPLPPTALSPATAEAYRTLRGTLAASRRNPEADGRVLLVTGSSPSEGKSTTAINTAASLAAAGNRVVLIEADLRRPSIGAALGLKPQKGVVSVLIESVPFRDALVSSDTLDRLKLLLADYEGDWITDLFGLPAARRTIEEARRTADYVVIDSPPLTDVVDALPLTNYIDDLLLVVRLGTTRIAKLMRLGELLAENAIKPVGFVVVETSRPKRSDYHYYQDRERRLLRTPGSGSASPQAPAAPERERVGPHADTETS